MSFDYRTRHEFTREHLHRENLSSNPFAQLHEWLSEAQKEVNNFNAMSLATCDENARISSRTVLLKKIENENLIFFTDARSRKANQLRQNPQVAVLFYWEPLERQIRIEGNIREIDRKQCHEYFQSRPREAQISSLTSHQSQPISSRKMLETRSHELLSKWEGKTIDTPDHWQGYLLKPYYWEFWQGGENRLHDRFCYIQNDHDWKITRLSP